MKAKVSIKLEIIEGEDTGYVLEEYNRIVNLERRYKGEDFIEPYRLVLDFITPDIMREYRDRQIDRELERNNEEVNDA